MWKAIFQCEKMETWHIAKAQFEQTSKNLAVRDVKRPAQFEQLHNSKEPAEKKPDSNKEGTSVTLALGPYPLPCISH